MKTLIIIFCLLALQSQAQTQYDATVKFDMGDTTDEAGTTLKRKGFIEAVLYNQRTSSINVQVLVKYFNNTTELRRFVKPYATDFTITDKVFVRASDGTVVGDRATMRQLYGVIQSPATDSTEAVWRQSVFGGDSLTVACMGQYTYLTRAFDNNNRFHNIIRALAIKASEEGKLNK